MNEEDIRAQERFRICEIIQRQSNVLRIVGKDNSLLENVLKEIRKYANSL